MGNNVLHTKLKDKFVETLHNISSNMIARFAIILPYDKIHNMILEPDTINALQNAGILMEKQYTTYTYPLGETVSLTFRCRGSTTMPTILFPKSELINFSEEFIDLIRPLYLITKSWQDVMLAFEAVIKIVQDTRELNFYIPWLRYIIPDRDFTNEFNAKFRVTQWLDLERDTHYTIQLITKQIQCIIGDERTSKRTWMPSELVNMIRQGEELITQYNIMKTINAPNIQLIEGCIFIEIGMNTHNHPTIKWAAEATTHNKMLEAERLKEEDLKKYNRSLKVKGEFR